MSHRKGLIFWAWYQYTNTSFGSRNFPCQFYSLILRLIQFFKNLRSLHEFLLGFLASFCRYPTETGRFFESVYVYYFGSCNFSLSILFEYSQSHKNLVENMISSWILPWVQVIFCVDFPYWKPVFFLLKIKYCPTIYLRQVNVTEKNIKDNCDTIIVIYRLLSRLFDRLSRISI